MEGLSYEKLYESEMKSSRTGLFYNLFSYPTKISPEVISLYIATHTNINDTILDVFGGSGTTAIAAKLCENPNERMIELEKKLGVRAKWGPRKSITYEIGRYGSFATKTLMSAPSGVEFKKIYKQYIEEVKEKIGDIYKIEDDRGQVGEIRHIIWCDVVYCSNCKSEISYFDVAVKEKPFAITKEGLCPCCGEKIKLEDCKDVIIEEYDELLRKQIHSKKRIAKKVYGETCGRKWARILKKEEERQFDGLEKLSYDNNDYPKEIFWGDLYRAGYHQGITHLHQFYTKRNYSVMTVLWSVANKYEKKISDCLKLLILSYNSSHATLMTRVVAKKKSNDFVLTGAQSGVLYISSLPVEKNILKGIERKVDKFVEAFDFLSNCHGEAVVINSSSTRMNEIKDESINYVFTDPPFGDYIPYAEVNQINELWLGNVTDRREEVIISQIQEKSISNYEDMLSQVFSEVYRVMKKDSKATVVFHSSKAKVWNAMRNSLDKSMLEINKASILDKEQGSFKQVNEQNSVKGDPIMLISKKCKGGQKALNNVTFESVAKNNLTEGITDEKHIYSRYLSECLENGDVISIDAKDAYRLIREKTGAM